MRTGFVCLLISAIVAVTLGAPDRYSNDELGLATRQVSPPATQPRSRPRSRQGRMQAERGGAVIVKCVHGRRTQLGVGHQGGLLNDVGGSFRPG